jgi:hypothetical protein
MAQDRRHRASDYADADARDLVMSDRRMDQWHRDTAEWMCWEQIVDLGSMVVDSMALGKVAAEVMEAKLRTAEVPIAGVMEAEVRTAEVPIAGVIEAEVRTA